MKKLTFILLGSLLLMQIGGCQDHDFKVPITVISIQYPDGTIQTTANSGTGIVDWVNITNKPNFVALYKPIGYVPTWAEITGKPTFFSGNYNDLTNKPAEIDLQAAISQLGYLPIPSKTTIEINALVMPVGAFGMIYDRTLNVYKVYKTGGWSILITDH